MMRRCWTLQLYARMDLIGEAAQEAEQKVLDAVACDIDFSLSQEMVPPGLTSLQADTANFNCFVGGQLIVVKRGCSAILWSGNECRAFARLIVEAFKWRHRTVPMTEPQTISQVLSGTSEPGGDGNHPRPGEEAPKGPEVPFQLIRRER